MTNPTIAPETLRITFGPVAGWNPKDPACSVCASGAEGSVQFGIAVDGAEGRICDDCAETAGPFGAALVEVVEALDSLESAVHDAPAEWRGHLLDAAAAMHNLLVEQYAPITEAENRDTLRGTVTAWVDERDAAIAAGGGSAEATDAANAALLRHLEELRGVLAANDASAKAVDEYIAAVKRASGAAGAQ